MLASYFLEGTNITALYFLGFMMVLASFGGILFKEYYDSKWEEMREMHLDMKDQSMENMKKLDHMM
jgi:hypothetical protein